MEKSRDAVTLSNLRAAYAQAQTAYLTEANEGSSVTYNAANSASSATVAVSGVVAKGTAANGLTSAGKELPFYSVNGTSGVLSTLDSGKGSSYTVTFTYDANGTITSVSAS